MSTLPTSLSSQAEEGINVYFDNSVNEYQHSVTVDKVIGIAQHRQGYLQVEQKSDTEDLKNALARDSNLGLNASECVTWIGSKNNNINTENLLARLHFGFDQSTLSPMGNRALNDLATKLRDKQNIIVVEGHTDSTGPAGYNQALGLQRALTTSNGLISKGVNQNHIVVRSYGETKPIASNSTAEGRAQNRRSEIWLSPNKSEKLESN
ncbi:OmpA family protein [Vibrio thalassae]|nr:OmpA family protein [Vibrio thalassae]